MRKALTSPTSVKAVGEVKSSVASGSGSTKIPPAFSPRPLQVTWQMTRPYDPKPRSRRKTAPRSRVGSERQGFSTAEAFHLIEQVADMHVPLLALTGTDLLERPDLFPILEFAARRGVRTLLTLLPTPVLEMETISELKERGVMRVAFWLHGSTAALDDAYWKSSGSHRNTLDAIGLCHDAELPVQINTTIARRNLHDLEPMIELLTRLDVLMWNVFFLVPSNPEQAAEMLSAREHENVFATLYAATRRVPFQIKTTEGQHYQRYLLEQRALEAGGRKAGSPPASRSTRRVNDGKDLVFIDQQGEAYPSRYLPLSAGNVMRQPLAGIYENSPLFVSLRDRSRLKGKCGRCEFRTSCGGSRARAYAMTGDLFAEDPCCAYQPAAHS